MSTDSQQMMNCIIVLSERPVIRSKCVLDIQPKTICNGTKTFNTVDVSVSEKDDHTPPETVCPRL